MQSLMTIKETADYLKLNSMTVYRLAQKGKIPAAKVGGAWRFRKETLDDWVNRQSRVAGEQVLVVEDDARVRDTLEAIISREGYSVVIAESGEGALDEIGRRDFDLVFLDLVLPGLSGVDVLQAIKTRAKRPAVVIVTGYADASIALEAMSLGPLLLLPKPFEVTDVVEVLNLVMKARH